MLGEGRREQRDEQIQQKDLRGEMMAEPHVAFLTACDDAIRKIREGTSCALFDMSEGQRVFFACRAAETLQRTVLYVTAGEKAAAQAAEDANVLLNGKAALLPENTVSFLHASGGREREWQRLRILAGARRGDIRFIAVSAETLMQRMMPPEMFDRAAVKLQPGDIFEPGDLIRALVKAGYERSDMVEGRGQCALRGSIVDVFPPDTDEALRIEFFDNEVDQIRTFDCISQRSSGTLGTVTLNPAREYLCPEDPVSVAREMRRVLGEQAARLPDKVLHPALSAFEPEEEGSEEENGTFSPADVPRALRTGLAGMRDDADLLEQGVPFQQLRLWAELVYDSCAFLPDWLPSPLVFADHPESLRGRMDDRLNGFELELKTALEQGEAVPEMAGATPGTGEVIGMLNRYNTSTLQDFLHGMSGMECRETVKLSGSGPVRYENRIQDLAKDIAKWHSEKRRVVLLSGGESRAKRLTDALAGLGIRAVIRDADEKLPPVTQLTYPLPVPPEAAVLPFTLSRGFVTEELCVIADTDIFGTGHHKSRTRRSTGERIEAFTDLKEGDYVVHDTNGIGVFRGVVRLQTEGTYRDYLFIQYQGSDKLYVPTDQFDRVQKFIGNTDTPPKLNSLSGNDWEKTRNKVRAGLKKLAFDLVKLYAERQETPGHAFGQDTPWQSQFEDLFPYELTPDQDRAVKDIKKDMESPINMDRLLCGDVGYGKTEVALRAAFKAVMDGKQAAILAPTTILAQQHYHTLIRRMRDFPVQVDVLSRFRSPAQQRETLRGLSEGKVDILVGTHRMLSKDVNFRDLGLLVVDEEQRFGVNHKESIKNLKKTVDVLTLSATPIPRTLHMSMVGVRDMSLLETPPEERYPVQTYVLDYNESVIRDAILRELARGGQVYFLYNRVSSIDLFCTRLRALVPEARIIVGHGQMRENKLEDVMMDFYEGKADVLLCSTIIENGLDVPLANTLIVYDADRFGLSQLYQLRGRVGRSNRAAYAYFTVRADKMLSETAQKRLDAIREFTAFGSGFRIAMRDLEIRGAGNIFGPEQSGNVSQVGYDMYCRLIEEAVEEARRGIGEKVEEKPADTRVELKIDAFLPLNYVSGAQQRMEIYKRISAIRTEEDRQDVLEELIDRFSDPPVCVENLSLIALARALAGRLGVRSITHMNGSMILRFDMKLLPDVNTLYSALESTDKRLMFSMGREPALLLRDGRKTPDQLLRELIPILEKLDLVCGR